MNLQETIRTKRRALGFTQERLAQRLGVSAAAVSKWEKGVSCPDIALLPALARLLGTDVNTLLSFEEALTRREIGDFVDRLARDGAQDGTRNGAERAFQAAAEKIRQYPNCHLLLLNAAMVVEGLFAMHAPGTGAPDRAQEIEEWYLRAAESGDVSLQSQAHAQLVAGYLRRGAYEKAQTLLDSLPPEPAFDRRHLQATLYARRQNWAQAARVTEAGLYQDAMRLQTALGTLMEVAREEGRDGDAAHLADVARQLARLLELNELTAHSLRLQEVLRQKDADGFLETMRHILDGLCRPWPQDGAVLYRHLPQKQPDAAFGKTMLAHLLADMEHPHGNDYGFVMDRPEYAALLAEYKAKLEQG